MLNKLKQTLLLGLAVVPMAHAYSYNGIDIHGFVGQGYYKTTENNYFGDSDDGSTHFTEAGVNVATWLNEKTRIGAQVYTYRLGDIGSVKDPMLDWAYVDYQHNEKFGVRIGRLKVPNGFYGEALDLDMSRPYIFLPQGVYRASWRDFSSGIFGVGFYGNLQMPKEGSIDYNLIFGKIELGSETGMIQSLSDSGIVNLNKSNNNNAISGQLIWNTNTPGLRFAASTSYINKLKIKGQFKSAAELSVLPGPNSNFAAIASVIGGSNAQLIFPNVWNSTVGVEYLWKDWTFAAEYNRLDAEVYTTVDHASAAAVAALNGTTPKIYNLDSVYVGAARRLSDSFELGAYYSLYYSNVDDRDGSQAVASGNSNYSAYQKDLAVALRYDITSNWLAKIEAHYINGTAQTTYYNNEPWTNKDDRWFMFAFKTTYFF